MNIQLKKLENPILRYYLVSKAHKNKIPNAVPMFSGMTFSMAIIFTSPGVAVTTEINMADKKRQFQFGKFHPLFLMVRLIPIYFECVTERQSHVANDTICHENTTLSSPTFL